MRSVTSSKGQNCSANKGDYRNVFSNKQRKAPWVFRPLNVEQRERRGLFFAIPVNSLAVDSVFEQSENVTIARFFLVNLSSCCWRGLAYTIIGSKLVALSYAHAHCTNRHAAWRPGSFSLSILLLIAHISHISRDCDIKHTWNYRSFPTPRQAPI